MLQYVQIKESGEERGRRARKNLRGGSMFR
jgi:hypothetical protein